MHRLLRRIGQLAMAGLPALTGVLPAGSHAQPSVSASKCRVQVAAPQASLKELLQKMASSLDFQLHYETQDDPRIAITGAYAPEALVSRLAEHASIAATYRTERRCPGQLQIATLWVMPSKLSPGTVAPHASIAQSATPEPQVLAPAPLQPGGPDEPYLKAHGLLP